MFPLFSVICQLYKLCEISKPPNIPGHARTQFVFSKVMAGLGSLYSRLSSLIEFWCPTLDFAKHTFLNGHLGKIFKWKYLQIAWQTFLSSFSNAYTLRTVRRWGRNKRFVLFRFKAYYEHHWRRNNSYDNNRFFFKRKILISFIGLMSFRSAFFLIVDHSL